MLSLWRLLTSKMRDCDTNSLEEVLMSKRLDGQTAIVTGAGRGIGRAIARELAATGANIVINYSTSADAASELADEIREIGPNALVVHADVTDYDQVTEMVKQTIEIFGQIDILVNNAGITRDKTLKNMSILPVSLTVRSKYSLSC